MKYLLVLFFIILECVRSQMFNSSYLGSIWGEPNINVSSTNAPDMSQYDMNSEPNVTLSDDTLYDIFGGPMANLNSTALPDVESKSCKCVHQNLCKNSSRNINGINIIDIRVQKNNFCGDYQLECCAEENIIEKPLTSRATIPQCGMRNSEGVGYRIVGDKAGETQFGEYPWMVGILKVEIINEVTEISAYICGASLIHLEVVLTAAHCVNNPELVLKIRAGEWDTKSKEEFYEHQERNVKDIIRHPDFRERGLHNDVALIIVDKPFVLMPNVQTVCLPSQDEVLENLRCIATGWGKTSFAKDSVHQVIMKKVELPIVQQDICQEIFRTTRVGMFFMLDKSLICAGGEPGIDVCTGDGGSPLVCPIPNKKGRYQQRGIVAWGLGCGDPIPGAYGNVAVFRTWIDNQMFNLKFDTSSYTV